MGNFLRFFILAISTFCVSSAYSQQQPVSGRVTGPDGNPVPFASIKIKGTSRGTQTTDQGTFSLSASRGEVLEVSAVGFTTINVSINSDNIAVRLLSKGNDLGEVVVTAYGVKRNKRELSYQAPVVKGDDISQTRRENFLNSLAGRVPGLTVTSTSGAPGASSQIILRGAVSISGSNQPLFVIDGVPVSNSTFNQENYLVNPSNLAATPGSSGFANRQADYTNRIADINPADIESVTILKGPEATSLYGSDGASGAIVITTRKGAAGKTRVSYDNSFRTDQVYRFPEIQSTYSRGINGIYDPTSYNASYGFLMFGPKYPAATTSYDNLHHFFKNSFSQQHNLSLESGSNDFSYRFSTGFVDQTGVVPTTAYKRIATRLAASGRISSKITMNSSWSYTLSTNNKASKGQGSYYNDLITWPIDNDIRQYLNTDGTRKLLRGAVTSNSYSGELDSPFWEVTKNPARDKTDRLTGTVNFSYDPAAWLNVSDIFGIDHYVTDGSYLVHPQSKLGAPVNGFVSIYTQNFRDINNTLRATVKKTTGDITHSLTAGLFFEDSKMTVNAEKGERFYELNFNSINNTDPTSQSAKLSVQNVRKQRAFGTYTAGFNNILFLNLGGSVEGVSTLTSAFFDKQPYFEYWSASGSFIFSDLDAFKSLGNWLSYGKLRASYATTGKAPGNAYVIDYRFVPQVTTGGGFALDVTGGNANLKPEYSKNLEVGGEFKFLQNKIGLDVAYYQINSKDQIISNRLSYGTGYVLKYINGGLVSNRGVEVQLTGTPVRSKNFAWDITFNFDHNKGIVKRMPADLPFYYDSDTWLFGNLRSQVGAGLSIASLAGNRLLRTTAGQLIISPTTGLPIKDASFVPVGDRNPDYKIGIINNFTLAQDFNISFNLDVRKGGDIFNGNEMMMVLTGVSTKTLDRELPRVVPGVLQDGLENTATPTKNTIILNPYFRNDFYSSMYTEADFIENVNWLRLRDLTLSYKLSNRFLQKQRFVKNAAVFVTGTDLFIITNYSGIDPNVSGLNSTSGGFGGSGIDYGSIPQARGINFGIKAQF